MDIEKILSDLAREKNRSVEEIRLENVGTIFKSESPEDGGDIESIADLLSYTMPYLGEKYSFDYIPPNDPQDLTTPDFVDVYLVKTLTDCRQGYPSIEERHTLRQNLFTLDCDACGFDKEGFTQSTPKSLRHVGDMLKRVAQAWTLMESYTPRVC